ncbi:PKD domain protein [Moritella viscosa]|uniref:PKD domain-containing protein n=1 Tax=Moritella viscosa TaxID=80854 RepID=UPI0005091726|nr:PKD domain-containing protein [Moritella viscosa]CED61263.1 putative lipoprotein [Moritella viscosa]SHO04510.1 PKD domain protein [Moritella viscosa]SHO21198.1 PKD domain protein [Moritella viscosa]
MNDKFKWLTCVATLSFLLGCNGGDESGTKDTGSSKLENQSPIAIAGVNQNVKVNTKVKLDGTSSVDEDNDLITYQWNFESKPQISQATLINSNNALSEFTADAIGTYIINLIVNDGKANSRPNQVRIVVASSGTNSPPTLNLSSDQKLNLINTAHLNANARDADKDKLFYLWQIIEQPTDSNPVLNDEGTSIRFKTDIAGDYVVKLTVSDGLAIATDTVTLSYYYANVPPSAKTGTAIYATEGMIVPVDASMSNDPNGDPITYQWDFVSKPPNSNTVIVDPSAMISEFYADAPGTYVVGLTVSDGEFTSKPYKPFYVKVYGLQAPHTKLFVGNDSKLQLFPYKEKFVVNKTTDSGSIPDEYILGNYTIEAVGKDVTISGINAINYSDAKLKPYFIGLSEGEIVTVKKGERMTFQLATPSTNGETVRLGFSFSWSLNGYGDFSSQETFWAGYQFTSR